MAKMREAINSALYWAKQNPDKLYSVYQIGGAWMFTSEEWEQTQMHYKRPLKHWTIVKLGDKEDEVIEKILLANEAENKLFKEKQRAAERARAEKEA